MITDERAEKALRYLAETDLTCAEAKANMERMEFKAKAIKQAAFKIADGSVADRNAIAETCAEHVDAMEAYFKAIADYSFIANKRSTEGIVMDTWRTIQANRRRV